MFFALVNGLDCGVDMLLPQLKAITETCGTSLIKNGIMQQYLFDRIKTAIEYQMYNMDKIPKNCDFLQEGYRLINNHLVCLNMFKVV
jgi:hypothetical protein